MNKFCYKFLIPMIFLFQLNLYGNSIHKDLELELFKNEEIRINGVLKFEKNKNRYEIFFEMPEKNLGVVLDTLSLKKEVKSVFLYDINRDNIKEIFIIYNENNKNSLEGYSIGNLYMGEDEYQYDETIDIFKTLNIATSQRLNKKIENIQNFNASLAKKELEELVPYYKVVNFNDYNIWDVSKRVGKDEYNSKAYLYQYELIPQDYEKFDLQKYFKIYSLDKLTFIKNIDRGVIFSDGNYYFLFQIQRLGLITLEEVFQGKISDESIIKNGEYFNEYENGNYEKNIKIGVWNSYEYSEELKRYLPIEKYFANGILIRKDILYRRSEELHTFSSTSYNSKNEIEEIKYYEENGDISQIKTYKDSILEKVVNYTHYKRNYSIYDKVINPQSGYEYYKARESLTQFKDLNLLNAKLENEELNLYSLKSSDNKEIFVVFQNYSPGKTSQDGIHWYEDPLKYFGIKEIFYGKRKSEKIKSYDDVVKDGYFEEFNLGYFPGAASITGSVPNIETVIKSGYFENGLKSGVWKSYDSSRGDIISSFSYAKGKLEGPYEIYFSNGGLKENGEYKDETKVILWEAGPQYWPSS